MQNNVLTRLLLPLVVVVGLLLGVGACSRDADPQVHKFSGPTMGTRYHVSVIGLPPELRPKLLGELIEQALAQVNESMSTYLPDSELSKFNSYQGQQAFQFSPQCFAVISAAQQLSQISNGAFDITVGPLVSLWGFGPQYIPDRVPAGEQIVSLKSEIGYQRLQLNHADQTVTKQGQLQIDLSAIAKGYAVDQLLRLIKDKGAQAAMVEVGGEVKAYGKKANGNDWRIAIEAPLEGERGINLIIALDNKAIATSGDYRNYFAIDGKRYSHTISPSTGYPIDHHLASVSVLHDSAMWADGWATALMVLGPKKGMALAEQQGIAAYFIVRTENRFEQHYVGDFKKYVQ